MHFHNKQTATNRADIKPQLSVLVLKNMLKWKAGTERMGGHTCFHEQIPSSACQMQRMTESVSKSPHLVSRFVKKWHFSKAVMMRDDFTQILTRWAKMENWRSQLPLSICRHSVVMTNASASRQSYLTSLGMGCCCFFQCSNIVVLYTVQYNWSKVYTQKCYIATNTFM